MGVRGNTCVLLLEQHHVHEHVSLVWRVRGSLLGGPLALTVGTLKNLTDNSTSASVLSGLLRPTLAARLATFLLTLQATRADLLDDEAVFNNLIDVLLLAIHLALLSHHVERLLDQASSAYTTISKLLIHA